MLWGKIRRLWFSLFGWKHKAYRQGECRRCGACCKIGWRCPLYDGSGCMVYGRRPKVCKLYPMVPDDIQPGCGFYFEE